MLQVVAGKTPRAFRTLACCSSPRATGRPVYVRDLATVVIGPSPAEHHVWSLTRLGKKAIEQPDYVIESKGTSRIIHATRIDVIPEFPVEKGFYVPDLRHGIPHGRSFPAEYAGAKYLSRDDTFVGPIIKRIMLYYGPVKRQDVSVEMRCSDNGLGVVVEDIRGELEAQ